MLKYLLLQLCLNPVHLAATTKYPFAVNNYSLKFHLALISTPSLNSSLHILSYQNNYRVLHYTQLWGL